MTPEEAELARLGYKQEFKREFSWISTFSFAFSISGLLATVPTIALALTAGYYHLGLSIGSWWTTGRCLVLVWSKPMSLILGSSVEQDVCVSRLVSQN
jgi:hypothetical protein